MSEQTPTDAVHGRKPGAATLAVLLATSLVAGLVVATASAAAGAADASSPAHGLYRRSAQLAGPVTTGHVIEPVSAVATDLAANGYEEQEYFASGTASAFRAVSSPRNGRWSIAPTTSAFYRTRILVRRPVDPARFNGTVVVEWMNVTVGETSADWDYLNPRLMAAGYAYVGVSAQSQSVNGGKAVLGTGTTGGLISAEPERYGSLVHPGDQYALDLFAQIGQALRSPGQPALGGLRARHVVATGESQSAFYPTTFADALQPRTKTFDGIFIHSRGGGGGPLDGGSLTEAVGTGGLRIRTDLAVPVFMFETQTDVIEFGYASAQQPDTADIRTWEVAGTSHADTYLVGPAAPILGCAVPINDGPQHEVVQAAFTSFTKWVARGTPPPRPPPFRLSSEDPASLALDAHGNVLGGVRTPAVDVPVSTLSGAGPSSPSGSGSLCFLFGSSIPFSPATLARLYHSRSHYLSAYRADLAVAVRRGYILPSDRAELVARAKQVPYPSSH